MGLDSYWIKPVGPGQSAVPPVFDREVNLIGGMFSGHGSDGSFRGKCYNWFVEGLTGLSLYEEMTPPGTTRDAAAEMRAWYEENKGKELNVALEETFGDQSEWGDVFEKWDDVDGFIHMFEKFSEAGYFLDSWY